MLPRIADIIPAQAGYLACIDALRSAGFKGQLSPEYAKVLKYPKVELIQEWLAGRQEPLLSSG